MFKKPHHQQGRGLQLGFRGAGREWGMQGLLVLALLLFACPLYSGLFVRLGLSSWQKSCTILLSSAPVCLSPWEGDCLLFYCSYILGVASMEGPVDWPSKGRCSGPHPSASDSLHRGVGGPERWELGSRQGIYKAFSGLPAQVG